MGFKVYSISVKDERLIETIDAFKESGGNLSGLTEKLYREYFFGDSNQSITEEYLKIREIERGLKEWEKWKENIVKELEELKKKIEIEQEIKETEEQLDLIRILEDYVFEDIKQEGYHVWSARLRVEPEQAISMRLSKFAVDNRISMKEAKELFFKVFPELRKELEGRL